MIRKKKPTADDFIHGARADEPATEKKAKAKSMDKKKRLTFYMTSEMYVAWEEYKLSQLKAGKKVSFQGVVEKHLNKILN